jgi:hypothetical protein
MSKKQLKKTNNLTFSAFFSIRPIICQATLSGLTWKLRYLIAAITA